MSVGPWQITRGGGRDNNPLGWDAEQFILENCQYLLYLRKDDRFFCRDHWDWATASVKQVTSYCPVCLGFGYKTDAQVVPARISLGLVDISARVGNQRLSPGQVEYFTSWAHFPRKIKPRLEDIVIVGEWDRPAQELGNYPRARCLRASSIYMIKQINDRFERELAFFSCGLEAGDHLQDKINLLMPYLTDVPVIQTEDSWKQKSYWSG